MAFDTHEKKTIRSCEAFPRCFPLKPDQCPAGGASRYAPYLSLPPLPLPSDDMWLGWMRQLFLFFFSFSPGSASHKHWSGFPLCGWLGGAATHVKADFFLPPPPPPPPPFMAGPFSKSIIHGNGHYFFPPLLLRKEKFGWSLLVLHIGRRLLGRGEEQKKPFLLPLPPLSLHLCGLPSSSSN